MLAIKHLYGNILHIVLFFPSTIYLLESKDKNIGNYEYIDTSILRIYRIYRRYIGYIGDISVDILEKNIGT